MKSPQAIPALIRSLADSDEYVAITALHSLEELCPPGDPIFGYLLAEISITLSGLAPHLEDEVQRSLRKWRRARRR
jgi:HEAT repeat protein